MYDSEVLLALEQAAAPVWTLLDDLPALFAEHENAHDDVASQLKAMRRLYGSSLPLLRKLQELQTTMQDRIGQFTRKFRRFENHISRTALNYGLNLLPDDVLYEIFVFAATTLDEKVALSLVCKRFRRVIMSTRKMWDGHWVTSYSPPEEIIAVAEGNRFLSLRARIDPGCYLPPAWVAKRGLDLKECSMRYFRFSVGLILSFDLEELEISVRKRDVEELESILALGNVQNLRSLVMQGASYNSASACARLFGKWHMPLLQSLEATFIPEATVARTLVSCKLEEIKEDQIDSLEEFLTAAKSLRDLRLFFDDNRTDFYEIYDLPSLQSLEVNFEPHPSLARHLVRCRLVVLSGRPFSLSRVLEFLSSSKVLQELTVEGDIWGRFYEDPGTTDASVGTVPSVVSCEFWGELCRPLVAKLHMPVLRALKLERYSPDDPPMITPKEFRTSLQSMSSLEDLVLRMSIMTIDNLDEIVRYAPPHLEHFSLDECSFELGEGWNTSPVPRRKLIRFTSCDKFFPKFMPAFVDYLRAVGLGRVKLQFSDCERCRDGIFELDDVMSARVST